MSIDPEFLRGMTPSQMLTTLMIDEKLSQHTKARAAGASCVNCMDTGMDHGRFCGCPAGSKLGLQSYQKD